MNVIKLYGGLGNQFFQYALGQAQKANGIEVYYENSWFAKPLNQYRPYCLDKFHTNVSFKPFRNQRVLNEMLLNYIDDMLFTRVDNSNFYGYWQHPRYFTDILPQLKVEFTVREEFYTKEYLTLKKEILSTDATSLHVRRGDYVQINGHHLLPLEYYQKALELVEGDVYVFSDDLPWCRENFSKSFIYVDLPEYLAFELMRYCSNNIIANSTFSWWAAYLNDNPDKKIVTPQQWRINRAAQSVVSKDILEPEGWTVITLPWSETFKRKR